MISAETATAIDEYRRIRHVVRNLYAAELDAERVDRLARAPGPAFDRVRGDLLAFGEILEGLADADRES